MDAPKVGVGVIVCHNGRFLLTHRVKAHGVGTWAPPGGHLEAGESWEDCARREVEEETGIVLKDIAFCGVTNDIFHDTGKHYVTLMMMGKADSDVFAMREPEKYIDYRWVRWEELPAPLFVCFANFVALGQKPAYLL